MLFVWKYVKLYIKRKYWTLTSEIHFMWNMAPNIYRIWHRISITVQSKCKGTKCMQMIKLFLSQRKCVGAMRRTDELIIDFSCVCNNAWFDRCLEITRLFLIDFIDYLTYNLWKVLSFKFRAAAKWKQLVQFTCQFSSHVLISWLCYL